MTPGTQGKNGVVWKVTVGVLSSALITLMSTTMVARAGMPTNDEVVTIVESKIGDHVTQKEMAEVLGQIRGDLQGLTLEVGKLIGRLDANNR